jgi:hypothetical protein
MEARAAARSPEPKVEKCAFAQVGLFEGLPDRSGHNRVLALRHVGESIAHPVNAAPLPSRFEDAGDRRLQAGVGVADHQLHPVEPTCLERS